MKKHVGMYAWGGPGTLQLLRTKYHSPTIDTASFLELYEYGYWKKAQELFGVTDAWLTYSWGFSEQRELESYAFVRAKLTHFQKLGIKTHGYVQGFNVVTDDFLGQDIFCQDLSGHRLPYSKGRSFTCPNSPEATRLILDRILWACQEEFDGIFIDNIIFGLPPIVVSKEFVPFFGCACSYCKEAFLKQFGYSLPLEGFVPKTLKDYLLFRADSVEKVVAAAFQITQRFKKQLGVNLYDPFLHTPELYFGYSLEKLDQYLSYFLFENHAHPARIIEGNSHLQSFIKASKKPVFVVSYKDGIGFEEQFSQRDLDLVFSEAEALHYAPCLKATEFTTNGVWHALRLEKFQRPELQKMEVLPEKPKMKLKKLTFLQRKRSVLAQKYAATILSIVYENYWLDKLARKLGLFQKQLWSIRHYDLSEFGSLE